MLFSADLLPLEAPHAPAVSESLLPTPRHELVVIDGAVPEAHRLAAGIVATPDRSIEVVVLSPTDDGFAQVSALLAERSGLDALHLVSHGREGAIRLGTVTLDEDSLATRAAALTRWHRAFSAGADVLLYGCDLAGSDDGIRFMETLGVLTGTDVAASDDATGGAALGGDWVLEQQFGEVLTPIAFDPGVQTGYGSVLTLLASDSFSGTDYLVGSSGGTGWQNAWTYSSGNAATLQQQAPGLSDPTGTLAVSGNGVAAVNGSDSILSRNLADGSVGQPEVTTWISFLVKVGQNAGSEWMGLEFGSNTSTTQKLFAGYSDGRFVLERSGDGPSSSTRQIVQGITPQAGSSYLIVLKLASVSGNDTITMYVNPTPGQSSPVTAYSVTKTDSNPGGFRRLAIYTSDNGAGFDELRVGTTFLDVAPGPAVNTAPVLDAS